MRYLLTLFLLLFFPEMINAQEKIFTAFWNVENLFDNIDQPDTDDAEFLPSAEKKWDAEKLTNKLVNLSTVIMSMNSGKGPDLMGLCEVENKAVVESLLVYLSPGYEIIHKESPDTRGIDNALIFKKEIFKLLDVSADTVDLGGSEKTRSILGGRFLLRKDTLSVFVNHWPSRRGGESAEQKRFQAALTLKKRMDSRMNSDFIIAMGDFNDEPEDISIDSVLGAGKEGGPENFNNLAYEMSIAGIGSYKYRDTWNMLDQIIVTSRENSIRYIAGSFEVYKPYFMVTQSGSYAGTARPTYGGKRYLGGYSDHFPVIAQFIIE